MAARTRLSLQSLLRRNVHFWRTKRSLHAEAAVKQPSYPAVVPSLTAKSKSSLRYRYELRLEDIKAAAVEEKIRLLTRIQRKKYVVFPQTLSRNADQWHQHFTKTAYIPGLPDVYSEVGQPPEDSAPAVGQTALPVIGEDTFEEIRSLVSHAVLQEQWYMKKREPFLYRRQEHFVEPFMRNLVAGVTGCLAQHNPLLLLASKDLKPEVNFYWTRGQRIIPRGHRRGRVEPIRFQIDDKPHSQIRIPKQLPQFAPMEAAFGLDVPDIKVSPDMMPLFKRQYENHIFTGAKLPDPCGYGHTQFHVVQDRYHRARLGRRGQEDQVEALLRAQGLASLFCWTGAQAAYQGFWAREDVPRPFVSQAVITDGQFFSFFCYQLNTLALSVDADVDNPRRNVLWGTESRRLFQGVEDGRVVGLDDGVLRLLVQFLMNRPLEA
ncbi:large ribosomal subunit protein mL65 [Gadus morhua]|uniref:Mitochondrial ribosomal protein S30 n=1 Tax=Gadus morhua TaxID=8049 RepID=A0A8C4ZFN9_GADMO|nr:39S ribosomal protein S30, mitochondrial [Gadus morhua]